MNGGFGPAFWTQIFVVEGSGRSPLHLSRKTAEVNVIRQGFTVC